MAEVAPKAKWKTLESNPDVINQFIHSLGVPKEWGFTDCFGLEGEALDFVPRPCLAVMFLYPTTSLKGDKAREKEDIETHGQNVSKKLYFVKQLVPNACGTIAVVHSIANNLDRISLEDKALHKFLEKTAANTAEERGELLGLDEGIAGAHELSAHKGQTRHDQVRASDFHFICFVEAEGALYEMDGGKAFPINHGPTSSATFVEDAARIVRTKFVSRIQDTFFSL